MITNGTLSPPAAPGGKGTSPEPGARAAPAQVLLFLVLRANSWVLMCACTWEHVRYSAVNVVLVTTS